MEERFMHPQNSDEIISELTKPNSEEMDKFVKTFPEEIVRFAESLSSAFKKFLELKYLTLNPYIVYWLKKLFLI